MDNICHTLTGAAIGEAGLKRLTRWGNPTLMLAANLPDLDALVFLTDVPSVAFRRGWTHGVVGQVVLPAMLTGLIVLLDRALPSRDPLVRARFGAVLALAYAGVLSHVFLDYLNNYGIRLLMPFSGRWFYGDAVFIIDPWLWLVLGIGIWWARRRGTVGPARLALGVSAAYIALMLVSAIAARRIVLHEWTVRGGAGPRALMVGPMAVNPFRKLVIVDTDGHYCRGVFEWWGARLHLDDEAVPKNGHHPAVVRAREDRHVQQILIWARFPYYIVTRTDAGTLVTLRDLRFGARVGETTVLIEE